MFLLDLLIQMLLHGCNTYHVLCKNTKIRSGLDFIYDLVTFLLNLTSVSEFFKINMLVLFF